jgi:sphinganine-1-phosphate aldolase
MEAEVVAMTLSLFHGPPGACGTMTSGGTESILMAVRAYREDGLRRRGIREPELVIAATAHAAFDKAADYFRVRLRKVPVDPVTFRADPKAMLAAVNANTIALVASAPCYPQGVIDPVEALAAGAAARGVPLHVDCCLGSFLIAVAAEATGRSLPPFDFSVPVRVGGAVRR